MLIGTKLNFNLIDTSLKNNQYNERSNSSGKRRVLKNYTENFFKAAWVDSLNLNDNKILEKFIKNMDINPQNIFREN